MSLDFKYMCLFVRSKILSIFNHSFFSIDFVSRDFTSLINSYYVVVLNRHDVRVLLYHRKW